VIQRADAFSAVVARVGFSGSVVWLGFHAVLAIVPQFDEADEGREDGPPHSDHIDEAACRIS
jgi:hypothetical protein